MLFVALVLALAWVMIWIAKESRKAGTPQDQAIRAHTRYCNPAGSQTPGQPNPMKDTTTHEVLPGQGIGPFLLHDLWENIDRILTMPYKSLNMGLTRVIQADPFVFEVNQQTRQVETITAWQGFDGSYLGSIRIGSTLRQVAELAGYNGTESSASEVFFDSMPGVVFRVAPEPTQHLAETALLERKVIAIGVFPIRS